MQPVILYRKTQQSCGDYLQKGWQFIKVYIKSQASHEAGIKGILIHNVWTELLNL